LVQGDVSVATTRSLVEELADIVGQAQVFVGDDIGERYRVDITRKYRSHPLLVVRPGSTEEVAAVVRVAAAHNMPLTPIGGQTGTAGGAIPLDGSIALSLERMNRIIEIDTLSMTMTVEAGCVLETAHNAAEADGALLPLDLGARGSAMIGGVIGTNAGGNRVIRWGMMRDMVLGLEAVLADGTIISSLSKMIKDNAGYNWKHALIGSEGTLAIVTRAVLRLRPLPTTRQTALIAARSFEDAIRVMRRLEVVLSGRLSSFEIMWEDFYRRMTEPHLAARPRPMPLGYPFYAIVEAMGGEPGHDDAQFERALAGLLEEEIMVDAVIAQSAREMDAIWSIREDMEGGVAPLRPLIAYDIGMAVRDMPRFVEAAERNVRATYPEAEMTFYGHAGDGNLHVFVSIREMNIEIARVFDTAVFDAVRDVGGSIAAEHAIGVQRAPYLRWCRSPEELDLMQKMKKMFDPQHILNPGKLLDGVPEE
jgi:FAD/FMN-containing dehydrogenase